MSKDSDSNFVSFSFRFVAAIVNVMLWSPTSVTDHFRIVI